MSYPIYRRPQREELLSQGDILDPEPLRTTLKRHQRRSFTLSISIATVASISAGSCVVAGGP